MKSKMAFSFNTTFLLASFLFAGLAFASADEQNAASNDLISEVCSKTRNPNACLAALRSDPGAAKADLVGLGHISIRLASVSAKATYKLIDTLLKDGKYKNIEGRLDMCSENYEDAIDSLIDTEGYLNKGDYAGMNAYASAVLNDPDDCSDEFETPPPEPPLLKKGNQDLENHCSIILAISNLLAKKH